MEQRIIKFRAWDANRKLMMLTGVIVQDGRAFLNDRDFEDAIQSGNYVMQFTGLEDKNGKEIYEGDVISWDSQRFVVEYKAPRFTPYMADETQCEVIGNIYENPELLKN